MTALVALPLIFACAALGVAAWLLAEPTIDREARRAVERIDERARAIARLRDKQ